MQVEQLEGSELMHWVHRAEAADPNGKAADRMKNFPAAGRYDHIVPPVVKRNSSEWNTAMRAYIKSKLGPEVE